MLNIDGCKKYMNKTIQKRSSQRKMKTFLKHHIRYCINVCVGRFIMV